MSFVFANFMHNDQIHTVVRKTMYIKYLTIFLRFDLMSFCILYIMYTARVSENCRCLHVKYTTQCAVYLQLTVSGVYSFNQLNLRT